MFLSLAVIYALYMLYIYICGIIKYSINIGLYKNIIDVVTDGYTF
jgi:hypothetical protein